ncbi:MAG: FKBP-type peptidyl-prolyl cis-trans isomerase [Deltaproteobacteria bacterium]|nr:MAG: FKBP-type peptidyl-prolyl cis-trans isomerase [Deltaproteobacteria bacterium]
MPPVEDWTVSETGLGWVDLQVGDGTSPQERSVVSVEYTGWLESGRVFDSSYKKAEPLQFVIGAGNVVKGWDEGIASMKAGGKRLLRVPPELHYGPMGRPPRIPPNATLLFEVELVAVGPVRPAPGDPPSAENWETRDGGLEVAVLADGPGTLAKSGDTVRVEYSGWLEDGTLFDSSLHGVGPIEFTLGRRAVIQGWDQGIEGMRTGEKRLLRIPPSLAYGSRGFPPVIGADATLLFEVELIEVR